MNSVYQNGKSREVIQAGCEAAPHVGDGGEHSDKKGQARETTKLDDAAKNGGANSSPPPRGLTDYATGTKATASSSLLDDATLEGLRLDQSHTEFEVAKKNHVRVRKPGKSWFRVLVACTFGDVFGVIEHESDFYLVIPSLCDALRLSVAERILILCVTPTGELFLWPLPTKTDYYTSGLRAANAAKSAWVRIYAKEGSYAYAEAPKQGELACCEPQFPDESFVGLLKDAFRDRIIDSLEHEVAQKTLGLKA